MKNEDEVMERFIVETAADGLVELFGEGYSDKVAAVQEEQPHLDEIENDINLLLGKYWDTQVEINGGVVDGNGDQDIMAKRSASFATLNFIAEIYNKYKARFDVETK